MIGMMFNQRNRALSYFRFIFHPLEPTTKSIQTKGGHCDKKLSHRCRNYFVVLHMNYFETFYSQ